MTFVRHARNRNDNALVQLADLLGTLANHSNVYCSRIVKHHHLGVGIKHAGKAVLMLVTITDTTVVHIQNREVLSTHTITENKNYWRNEKNEPGR